MFQVSFPEDRLGLCNIPKLILIVHSKVLLNSKTIRDEFYTHMPDWSVVNLDLSEGVRFVRDHYPEYLSLYNKFKYAKDKVKLLKYLWLHLRGGICIESGYILNQPLDSLFYQDSDLYFLSTDCMGYRISEILMGSKQGCKFWIDLVNSIDIKISNTLEEEYLEYYLVGSEYSYLSLPVNLIAPELGCRNTVSNIGMIASNTSELDAIDDKIKNVGTWAKRNPDVTSYVLGSAVLILLLILMLVTIPKIRN